MKKITFLYCLIFLIIFNACDENLKNDVFKVKTLETAKIIFKKDGDKYVFINCQYLDSTNTTFPDGFTISEQNDNCNPPKKENFEYVTWKVEKIDSNNIVLLFETKESHSKQKWRFNMKFNVGKYEDFQNGKTVELICNVNELKEYNKNFDKLTLYSTLLYANHIIPESAKFISSIDNFKIQLNKDQLIESYSSTSEFSYKVYEGLQDKIIEDLKNTKPND